MEKVTIDKDKLRELASDGSNATSDISEGLGLGAPHNLYYHLNKDAELKKIFEDGRASVGKPRAKAGIGKGGGKKGSKRTPAPPRNSNAKGGVNKDLLAKLLLEFDHVDVYGSVSEHFAELRDQLAALL